MTTIISFHFVTDSTTLQSSTCLGRNTLYRPKPTGTVSHHRPATLSRTTQTAEKTSTTKIIPTSSVGLTTSSRRSSISVWSNVILHDRSTSSRFRTVTLTIAIILLASASAATSSSSITGRSAVKLFKTEKSSSFFRKSLINTVKDHPRISGDQSQSTKIFFWKSRSKASQKQRGFHIPCNQNFRCTYNSIKRSLTDPDRCDDGKSCRNEWVNMRNLACYEYHSKMTKIMKHSLGTRSRTAVESNSIISTFSQNPRQQTHSTSSLAFVSCVSKDISYEIQLPLRNCYGKRSHLTKYTSPPTTFFKRDLCYFSTPHISLLRCLGIRSFLPARRNYHHSRLASSSASDSTVSSSLDQNDNRHLSEMSSSDFFDSRTFASLGLRSRILRERIQEILKLDRPTQIQGAAFDAMTELVEGTPKDLIIGAETGTGKTLAYLVPLIDDILQRKAKSEKDNESEWLQSAPPAMGYQYARALILVPNKELVQQVVRMALPLAGGPAALIYPPSSTLSPTLQSQHQESNMKEGLSNDEISSIVRIAILPGGLKEASSDFLPFRNALNGKSPPIDLIISTPAAIGPLGGANVRNIDMFRDIQTVIMDEADMLLDGGYFRPLQDVMLGFKRADRYDNGSSRSIIDQGNLKARTQYVFVAATLPDYGLRSVDAYLQRKFPRIVRVLASSSGTKSSGGGMHNARHYGLSQPTVWLNIPSKKERMKRLVRFLVSHESDGDDLEDNLSLKNEKVIIFLNSVDDVDKSCLALNQYGESNIIALRYHAKMTLDERTAALEQFRQYEPPSGLGGEKALVVLVCTDLASRGLDVPGVTAVVQLQFATNVVAHLHRMGRCGRAGNRTGRGIIFYDDNELDLVRVIQQAEEEQQQQQQQHVAKDGRRSSLILTGDVPLTEDDDILDNESLEKSSMIGTVTKAFSRKRGFTKKIKKMKKQSD